MLVADNEGKIWGCNSVAKQLLGSAQGGDAIDKHLRRAGVAMSGYSSMKIRIYRPSH